MFAHAMRSTNATAPNRPVIGVFVSPATYSVNGIANMPQRDDFANVASSSVPPLTLSERLVRRALAIAIEMPGLIRATPIRCSWNRC